MKKNVTKRVQVVARVTLADYRRLKEIQAQYGFRSVYQIMNYLAYAFLRVADREHDPVQEAIPDEIADMFSDLGDSHHPVPCRRARSAKRSTDL